MTTEPVEKLEEVFLDDSKLNRTTKIETLASPAVRQALTIEIFFFFGLMMILFLEYWHWCVCVYILKF